MASLETSVSSLLTDVYQLTMMQSYLDARMDKIAVFEFFVRKMPPARNFLVAGGLEQLLDYLEQLAFTDQEISWLRGTRRFSESFLDYLRGFRFTGDVQAMPEGTIFFENEPIVRVVAPIPQAQLVESRLINILHFQTLIASKAIRSVLVAPEKFLVDFGLRRAHGAEAATLASRASYIAGFHATSNVLAGRLFGIPISGTMAHSYIEAHASERFAMEHFAESQLRNITLLVDTYDTEEGARIVTELTPLLQRHGIEISSVRLDSGDLAKHARNVREILDRAGLERIRIFVSGGLDERDLRELQLSGAPIDGFGIGTKLATSADASYLDCAYKLEEYDGTPRRKTSEGKETWPGRKQVFRSFDSAGKYVFDLLALESERHPGRPLLEPVLKVGRRIKPSPALGELRKSLLDELQSLPRSLLGLDPSILYPIRVSDELRRLAIEIDNQRKHQAAVTLNREGPPP